MHRPSDGGSDGPIGGATQNQASAQVSGAVAALVETPSVLITSRSHLSARDQAIVTTVKRFRQVSSRHIQRLHFADGSPKSRDIRTRATLQRLVRWGQLQRLYRPVGGHQGGSTGYIYLPPGSRARVPDPHTIDIVELYVSLVDCSVDGLNSCELLAFDPEPYSHVYLGHLEVKPDAYIRLKVGEHVDRYFVEVDRGTEWRPQLGLKMKRYTKAYEAWTEPTFPQVLWTVPDEQRARLIESVIKKQPYPELLTVVLLERVLDQLVGAPQR